MHPEIEALANTAKKAAELLNSVGKSHWSAWLARDAALLLRSDFRGVEELLSAFGGMGSINDLVIHPMNGHNVQENDISKANEQLQELLSEIPTKAKKLYYEELQANRRT